MDNFINEVAELIKSKKSANPRDFKMYSIVVAVMYAVGISLIIVAGALSTVPSILVALFVVASLPFLGFGYLAGLRL